MANDYDKIKAEYPIQNVIGAVVKLERRQNNYFGLCPFHGERTPSFQVNPRSRKFKCFGCGAGGDVIDFVKKYYGIQSDKDAITKLTGRLDVVQMPEIKITASDLDNAKNIMPAPEPGQIVHKKYGAPAMRFDYRDAEGKFLFATCRFNIGKSKIVLPYSYWEAKDGKRFWSWRGVPMPRPLYGLDRLAKNKTATVVIVEGEKAADAAQRLLPHAVCLTWCGGVNNIKSADFSPISGRRLIIWRDADSTHTYGETHPRAGNIMDWQDQPGTAAMIELYNVVKDFCPLILWAEPPEDVFCGWDAADAEIEGWDTNKVRDFLKNSEHAHAVIEKKTQPQAQNIEWFDTQALDILPVAEKSILPPVAPPDAKTKTIKGSSVYYKALGFEISDANRTLYWVFNYEKQTALCFSSNALSREPALFEIAPPEYWETYFHKKNGIDSQNAAANIMAECTKAGYFKLGLMRGRGAWIDEKPVFNTGSNIILDGAKVPIAGFASKYTYSRGDEIHFTADRLSDEIAWKIAAMFRNVNFERITGRYLLAGWAVLAPFCGALSWRPHIWLSGSAGTGKSWLLSNIVRRMVGENIGLFVQGNTTEAGIRQTMRQDALPVIFDEAEAEDEAAAMRIKGVLELARASSAQNSGTITKGSAGGRSTQDAARMAFCFSSIVVSATQESDLSRISNINIVNSTDSGRVNRWQDLQKDVRELLTPENCEMLRARTLFILPVILQNIKILSDAFRECLGDQRAGDQLGALVAGAWSLHKTTLLTTQETQDIVNKYDWSQEVRDRENSDAERLLSRIREHIVKLDGMRGTVQMTLGEMIEYASGKPGPASEDLYNYDYAGHLSRLGIISEGKQLIISNSSGYIKYILRGSPWAVNWHKVLIRIPGASGDIIRRFATVSSRAVSIPTEFFQTKNIIA